MELRSRWDSTQSKYIKAYVYKVTIHNTKTQDKSVKKPNEIK